MPDFDPHSSWQALYNKANDTDNPLHKTLLTEVGNHMQAEIKGQLAPLMDTLHTQPVYHFWRVREENMILSGFEAVSGFYSQMFDTGGNQFQVISNRIFVDDTGVITEGKVRQIYKSSDLAAMGVTTAAGQAIDSHELWLSNTQLITVWPHAPASDDTPERGPKLLGEDIYFGENPMDTLQPFHRDGLPDYYQL